MTTFDRFERSLPMLLDDLAGPRLPEYTDDVLARTAATRQRPGWSFPERWLPMSALTRRLAAVPHVPWRLGALVALLVVAALVALLVAGTLNKTRLAPYGPAANGRIAFVDDQGSIIVGDPATGTTATISREPDNSDPLFSQDGSRVFYLHHRAGGTVDVVVAATDGSAALTLNPAPIAEPSFGGWSARGDHFLLVSGGGQLLLYDTSRTAQPRNLSAEFNLAGRVSVGLGYNFRSTAAFRPPAGDEIVFTTQGGRPSLMAVRLDGTGLRTILDGANPATPYVDLSGAEWSPDGSRLLVLLAPVKDTWHLFVMNADGSGLRRLADNPKDRVDDVNSPLWSPDGTRIAFQYWSRHTTDDGQDINPLGVVDVATGVLRKVGPKSNNGYISWEWSPDGASILELPDDGSGKALIVDVASGKARSVPWSVSRTPAVSWQRTTR